MFLISKLSKNDIKVKKQKNCFNCFRGLKFWRDHNHPVIALSEPVIIFVLFWPYMDSAALSEPVIKSEGGGVCTCSWWGKREYSTESSNFLGETVTQ